MLVSLPPTVVVYSQPDTGMVFLYARCDRVYFVYVRDSKEVNCVMYSYSGDYIVYINIYIRKVSRFFL